MLMVRPRSLPQALNNKKLMCTTHMEYGAFTSFKAKGGSLDDYWPLHPPKRQELYKASCEISIFCCLYQSVLKDTKMVISDTLLFTSCLVQRSKTNLFKPKYSKSIDNLHARPRNKCTQTLHHHVPISIKSLLRSIHWNVYLVQLTSESYVVLYHFYWINYPLYSQIFFLMQIT